MIGRRYSEGLHQAIEAKEGVEVKRESKTLATITFQNLFRMYEKLSGMTGTAMTEEQEFREIYGMDVIEIPTNKPVHPNRSAGCRLQDPQRASSTPLSNRSKSATTRASRSWSAPSRSRTPRS